MALNESKTRFRQDHEATSACDLNEGFFGPILTRIEIGPSLSRSLTSLQDVDTWFTASEDRQAPISVADVLSANTRAYHKRRTTEGWTGPGCLRFGPIEVIYRRLDGEEVLIYQAPAASLLPVLLSRFVAYLNADALCRRDACMVVLRAALAHYYINRLHPFNDGNGRTARLVESEILVAGGFKSNLVPMMRAYYKAFSLSYAAVSLETMAGGEEQFLRFVVDGVAIALDDE